MLTARDHRSLYAYQIDPGQSQRIVEQAVRARVAITLTPGGDAGRSLCGTIDAATIESLWIEVDQAAGGIDAALQSVCCEGRFELNGTRYLLDSNVLAVVDQPDNHRVEIVRPSHLQIIQRRRFWRARVQDSSPVLITRTDAGDAEGWSCRASMMNVSADGLACLAGLNDADATTIGQRLRIVVRVSKTEEPLTLDAVLKSKTAAATRGQAILGFQFDLDPSSPTRQRLLAALNRLAQVSRSNWP